MTTTKSDQEIIDEIKAEMAKHIKDDEGLFRVLCRLAKFWNLRAGHFRSLLVRAKMPPSRASELKQLLLYDDIRDAFLRKRSRKNCLADARRRNPKAKERALKKLLRLLDQVGYHWPNGTSYGVWTLHRDAKGQARFTGNLGILEVLNDA